VTATGAIPRPLGALVVVGAISLAIAVFATTFGSAGVPLPVSTRLLAVSGLVGVLLAMSCIAVLVRRSRPAAADLITLGAFALLIMGVWVYFLTATYQLTRLMALRVDLLSYSESGFVNDVLRIGLGLPVFASPLENQSTVYTPVSPILTRQLALLFGPVTVASLRAAQFVYVVLAALVATAVADRLARLVAPERFKTPLVWCVWWAPALLIVSTEPRFNAYTPSLNSDGFALAISMGGFLLMAQHALAPRRWHLAAMALLPALGFFVKQNMLAWIGIFGIYLLAGGIGFLRVVVFGAIAGAIGLAAIGAAYALWGSDYWFWAVASYAPKTVSLARGAQHLLGGGAYVAMGLAAGVLIAARRNDAARRAGAIWLAWLALMIVQAYTSGFAWAANHLGPSVVMAFVWLTLVAVCLWPARTQVADAWRFAAVSVGAAGIIIGIMSGLGFPRVPEDPVPPDLERYAAAIEREFEHQNASRILMDYGTWIYLERNVVMRDRGFATHVHVEPNQPIAHDKLVDTIARIAGGSYDKILVRGLDAGRSSYDYGNRGSGIREAIHAHYREVRRIPGVTGVEMWRPVHMLEDIQVFERQ
jgi:hypothetical protein